MNIKRIIISGLLATALFITGGFIQFDTGNISVNQYTADILSVDKVNSYALLEKTGCIVDSKVDKIRLRFDLYLTENAPGYDNWHIRECTVDEKTGVVNYTGEWVNTPYLCVFVYVNADDTDDYIKQLAKTITIQAYNHYIKYATVRNVNLTLNPLLKAQYARPDTSKLSKDIRLFNIKTSAETYTVNPDKTTISIGGNEVLLAAGDPIDVGSAAIARYNSSFLCASGIQRTLIDFNNPANDTGTLDTIEIYLPYPADSGGVTVGTFYEDSSAPTFTCRDAESLGTVSGGSKQTITGLDIDVGTGDYLGAQADTTSNLRVERGSSGGSGVYIINGRYCSAGSSATFYVEDGDGVLSLYGTGETLSETAPTITQSSAINITATSARLPYNLTDDGGDDTTVKVYWGTSDGGTGTWQNSYSLGVKAEGAGYYDVSGLSNKTKYYFRYYAENSAGGTWASSTLNFTTLAALPSVTTGSASSITSTSFTMSGNVTGIGGENVSERGFCYIQGTSGTPTTANSKVYDSGSYGTGSYSKAITGLTAGTSYRVRAYAINSAGTAYGSTITVITLPNAPISVSATDGAYTDKVRVTWTKSTGATGYKVYRNDTLIDTLGDVNQYDDITADAGSITAGTASASQGTYTDKVVLSVTEQSTSNGTSYTYKVVAVNASGDSAKSSGDSGYRGIGSLTYQWQKSASDSNADYSNIIGATTTSYNDTDGVVSPDGRYYKCVLSAIGAASQTTGAVRGYKAVEPTVPIITNGSGASNIEATAATLNGKLTDNGTLATTIKVYWGTVDGGTTAGNWNYNYSLGVKPVGDVSHNVTGLPTGTVIYYRFYAENSIGGSWTSSSASFLTKPAAPTNIDASQGTYTDKVVITWIKSVGATGYKIYRNDSLIDTIGDVAIYNDTTANAGTITAGTASASEGNYSAYVKLSISGEDTNNGTSYTYKVTAINISGESAKSNGDNGYRGIGDISYQWQVSAGDSDTSYSAISGATTNPYSYFDAPDYPDARYYRCVLSAPGASNVTTNASRGYKADFIAPTVSSISVEGFGGTWIIFKGRIDNIGDDRITQIGIDYGLTDGYGESYTEYKTISTDGKTFLLKVEGLSRGTVYNWRVKAYNSYWGYGENMYASTEGSPVIYEYLNVADDAGSPEIYGINWASQSFTTENAHTITSVNLYIKRTGLPGTVTVSLRHATAALLPTGEDLFSATFNGDTLSTSYNWISFDVPQSYFTIEAENSYAIVLRAVNGDDNNYIEWAAVSTSSYIDGTASISSNNGTDWISEAPTDYLFEVWGNEVMQIIDIAVYPDYKTKGDLIFLINYLNEYPPYYPDFDPSRYFYLQIVSVDGNELLHQVPLKQWGNSVGAIYLNAQTVASINQSGKYYIKIFGDFGTYPVTAYQLSDINWLGKSEVYLKNWIMLTAQRIAVYYDRDLTVQVTDLGTVLNEVGGAIFAIGIPDIVELYPDFFSLTSRYFIHHDKDLQNRFDDAATWQALVGQGLATVVEETGTVFGLDGKTIFAIVLIILYVLVVILAATNLNITVALGLAFPFLIIGALLRVIDIALILTIALIALIALVISIVVQRT